MPNDTVVPFYTPEELTAVQIDANGRPVIFFDMDDTILSYDYTPEGLSHSEGAPQYLIGGDATKERIAAWHAQGIRMCVVTHRGDHGGKLAAETLQKFGLVPYFDFIVYSREFEKNSDGSLTHTKIGKYLACLQAYNIPPAQAAVIDDMDEFIASAQELGIKTAQVVGTDPTFTQMRNAEIAAEAYEKLNAIVSPASSLSPLVSNSMFAPVAAAAASAVPSQDASTFKRLKM